MPSACRGEIWDVRLPISEHDYHTIPALIISRDELNTGHSDGLLIIPCAENITNLPTHIKVEPPESGLRRNVYIKCEQIRYVLKERLINRVGSVSSTTLSTVEKILRIIIDL